MTIDGIVEDITLAKARDAELKAEANAAAEQADQLARSLAFKSAVLSAVGHDLRTPLAVLSSSASTLGDATGLSETERAELIDNVQDSARSLEALVVDLLDVQRIDVGAIEVRSEAVRLWEVLEDALRHLPAVAMDIPDDFPAIEADAGLLARVLDNLLRNAALHADSDRPVELSATWDTDHALISVVDHGIGVPEHQFSRLFEPFDRLRDDRPGAGVGLWIAHQFAGAMGMTLDPGETPGGGLTMTVKARLSGAPTAHC